MRKGDRVLFHRQAAQVELVADAKDPEASWYVQEYGGGVLIREPNDPNPTFISADSIRNYEDLEFVSRGES